MKNLIFLLLMIQSVWTMAQTKPREFRLTSPDKKVGVTLTTKSFTENGQITEKVVYSVTLNGKEAILASALGLVRDDQAFAENLTLVSASKIKKVNEHFSLKSGKKLQIHHQGNEQVFTFRNKNDAVMELVFRASNDGIAFRYRFPEKAPGQRKMTGEKTTFSVPLTGKAFIHPYDLNSFGYETISCDANGSFTLRMAENGGFVAVVGKGK